MLILLYPPVIIRWVGKSGVYTRHLLISLNPAIITQFLFNSFNIKGKIYTYHNYYQLMLKA